MALSKILHTLIFTFLIGSELSTPRKIHIIAGEQKEIELWNNDDLQVSHQGILDLTHLEGKRWLLTGIRKGLTTIQRRHFSRFSQQEKIFVQVHAKEDTPKKLEPPQATIQKTEIKEVYFLQAKIFLAHDLKQELQGLNASANFSLNKDLALSSAESIFTAQFDEQSHNTETIASPAIWVAEGENVELSNGGEFQDRHNVVKNYQEIELKGWKKYGLNMEFSVHPLKDSFILLKIHTKISSRHAAQQNSELVDASIATQLPLQLDRAKIIGGVDLSSDFKSQGEPFSISQVPIIGPLFSVREHTRKHAKLFICVLIRKEKLL